MADITGYIHIRQELHFNAQLTLPLAGFAAPTMDIEGKAASLIPAHFAFRQFREQLTHFIKHAGIGAGIGTRCAANG